MSSQTCAPRTGNAKKWRLTVTPVLADNTASLHVVEFSTRFAAQHFDLDLAAALVAHPACSLDAVAHVALAHCDDYERAKTVSRRMGAMPDTVCGMLAKNADAAVVVGLAPGWLGDAYALADAAQAALGTAVRMARSRP